jgi:hypothetical protein
MHCRTVFQVSVGISQHEQGWILATGEQHSSSVNSLSPKQVGERLGLSSREIDSRSGSHWGNREKYSVGVSFRVVWETRTFRRFAFLMIRSRTTKCLVDEWLLGFDKL